MGRQCGASARRLPPPRRSTGPVGGRPRTPCPPRSALRVPVRAMCRRPSLPASRSRRRRARLPIPPPVRPRAVPSEPRPSGCRSRIPPSACPVSERMKFPAPRAAAEIVTEELFQFVLLRTSSRFGCQLHFLRLAERALAVCLELEFTFESLELAAFEFTAFEFPPSYSPTSNSPPSNSPPSYSPLSNSPPSNSPQEACSSGSGRCRASCLLTLSVCCSARLRRAAVRQRRWWHCDQNRS